ncbi:MAG: class I fructose-bisphosphate aldolase [Candidatus Thermoplasmatota archaeon]
MQNLEEIRKYMEGELDSIKKILGEEADYLLDFDNPKIKKEDLYLPGFDFIDRVFKDSDRNSQVLRNLKSIFNHGRLAGSGYLSILPVDQGVEHSAGADFAPNPIYFDPKNIVKLAIEGGCNAVASTLGILGSVSRKYAHKIPFIVKINHNELLSYPNSYDQRMFADVEQAWSMGAAAIGCTIYFGSSKKLSNRQIEQVSKAFKKAHELGMGTVLWCYLRNPAFKVNKKDYHSSADLTGQANYLGSTLEADIVKQKQATLNGGFLALNKKGTKYGRFDEKIYNKLTSDHPIDLVRYQVANCYMGRVGLINSGGASGENDFKQAVRTAVINKRAGGMGLISGRKSFQKPMKEGIDLLHAIQDVYLSKDITIA